MRLPSRSNARQFLAFLAVGLASAAVDFSVFMALHRLGLVDIAANVVAYSTAFCVNYFGNRNLVFKASQVKGAFWRYCLLVAGNLVISTALVRFGLTVGWPDWLAKGGSMAVVATVNFFALRLWVFRAREPRSPEPVG